MSVFEFSAPEPQCIVGPIGKVLLWYFPEPGPLTAGLLLSLPQVERDNTSVKHAQFVDFCEDMIFEMRHTARVMGEAER